MARSHTQDDLSRRRHHWPNADVATDGVTAATRRAAPSFTVYTPKVSRNFSFTSGMPLAISSSVGRVSLISSRGFAPAAGLIPLITDSAWFLTWISAASLSKIGRE